MSTEFIIEQVESLVFLVAIMIVFAKRRMGRDRNDWRVERIERMSSRNDELFEETIRLGQENILLKRILRGDKIEIVLTEDLEALLKERRRFE